MLAYIGVRHEINLELYEVEMQRCRLQVSRCTLCAVLLFYFLFEVVVKMFPTRS